MYRVITIVCVCVVALGSIAVADPFLSLNVAPGDATNGWDTTPVDLTAPGVLDWYVGNNTNLGEDPNDPETWDWFATYNAPGNQKAGASILSDFYLGYTGPDTRKGYTGGHTVDSRQVHFVYSDGEDPEAETDRIGTNWMTDLSGGNGIMRVRVDASANGGNLRITQWFNYSDAWEETDWGHVLTASLYDANDVEVSRASWSDSISGLRSEGETYYGFAKLYTATVDISGAGPGSYLTLQHETSNIGYRGTMVSVPVPGAALLGMLGLGMVGWVKRRKAVAGK